MYINDDNIILSPVTRLNQLYHRRAHDGDKMEIYSYRSYGLIPEIMEQYKKLPQLGAIFFDAYFENAKRGNDRMNDLSKLLPKTKEMGWRCSAINANSFYSLENYAAALNNLDAISITKGGFAVGTVGIEKYIGAFSEAFVTLPAIKFNDITFLSDPVRGRERVVEGRRYFYLLNRLPYNVKVNLKLSKGDSAKSLTTLQEEKLSNIRLKPYELLTYVLPLEVTLKSAEMKISFKVRKIIEEKLNIVRKAFTEIKNSGIPFKHYLIFMNAAERCLKEKQYARLHILLQESWVNDMIKLLKDQNLQAFLKSDPNFIKKQNRRRVYIVKKSKNKIIIDGKLDEKTWKTAVTIDKLAEFFKFKGKLLAKPATLKTVVHFLYDDENLYLGITCDNPDTDNIIIKKDLHDAALWNNDSSVEFFLKGDDMPKGKLAQMATNAASSKTEIFGGGAGTAWNPKWNTKSIIIPGKGWQCEMAIPLKEIGKNASNNLLFNIARHAKDHPKMALCFINQSGGLFCEDLWAKLKFEK